MTPTPFASLTERGQAHRLRPLARAALRDYDIDVTGLQLIINGWNGVFRVDTPAGPLVLRISRPVPGENERPVSREVEFMTALAAGTDVSVPSVIPSRDGELVTWAGTAGVPEPRQCVVFGWLDGPDLDSRVSATNWARLGQLMARMDRFSQTWTPSPAFRINTFEHVDPYGEWDALEI